jgi:hypothetical protein
MAKQTRDWTWRRLQDAECEERRMDIGRKRILFFGNNAIGDIMQEV